MTIKEEFGNSFGSQMKLTEKQRKRLADIIEKTSEAIFVTIAIGYWLNPENVSTILAVCGLTVSLIAFAISLQIDR